MACSRFVRSPLPYIAFPLSSPKFLKEHCRAFHAFLHRCQALGESSEAQELARSSDISITPCFAYISDCPVNDWLFLVMNGNGHGCSWLLPVPACEAQKAVDIFEKKGDRQMQVPVACFCTLCLAEACD
jgi:hypothetical protein